MSNYARDLMNDDRAGKSIDIYIILTIATVALLE